MAAGERSVRVTDPEFDHVLRCADCSYLYRETSHRRRKAAADRGDGLARFELGFVERIRRGELAEMAEGLPVADPVPTGRPGLDPRLLWLGGAGLAAASILALVITFGSRDEIPVDVATGGGRTAEAPDAAPGDPGGSEKAREPAVVVLPLVEGLSDAERVEVAIRAEQARIERETADLSPGRLLALLVDPMIEDSAKYSIAHSWTGVPDRRFLELLGNEPDCSGSVLATLIFRLDPYVEVQRALLRDLLAGRLLEGRLEARTVSSRRLRSFRGTDPVLDSLWLAVIESFTRPGGGGSPYEDERDEVLSTALWSVARKAGLPGRLERSVLETLCRDEGRTWYGRELALETLRQKEGQLDVPLLRTLLAELVQEVRERRPERRRGIMSRNDVLGKLIVLRIRMGPELSDPESARRRLEELTAEGGVLWDLRANSTVFSRVFTAVYETSEVDGAEIVDDVIARVSDAEDSLRRAKMLALNRYLLSGEEVAPLAPDLEPGRIDVWLRHLLDPVRVPAIRLPEGPNIGLAGACMLRFLRAHHGRGLSHDRIQQAVWALEIHAGGDEPLASQAMVFRLALEVEFGVRPDRLVRERVRESLRETHPACESALNALRRLGAGTLAADPDLLDRLRTLGTSRRMALAISATRELARLQPEVPELATELAPRWATWARSRSWWLRLYAWYGSSGGEADGGLESLEDFLRGAALLGDLEAVQRRFEELKPDGESPLRLDADRVERLRESLALQSLTAWRNQEMPDLSGIFVERGEGEADRARTAIRSADPDVQEEALILLLLRSEREAIELLKSLPSPSNRMRAALELLETGEVRTSSDLDVERLKRLCSGKRVRRHLSSDD